MIDLGGVAEFLTVNAFTSTCIPRWCQIVWLGFTVVVIGCFFNGGSHGDPLSVIYFSLSYLCYSCRCCASDFVWHACHAMLLSVLLLLPLHTWVARINQV